MLSKDWEILKVHQYNPGQLSLLPSPGLEMSTSQSVVILCAWRGMAHLWRHLWVEGKAVYLVNTFHLPCIPELLRSRFSQYKALYKSSSCLILLYHTTTVHEMPLPSLITVVGIL